MTALIPPADLIASFTTNPHLPLISIKSRPYHHSCTAVILGDAAHAMVPFYGQGMNAGLEDVRVLFSLLDKYAARDSSNAPGAVADEVPPAANRALALAEYTALRVPDAHAINDLALQNYIEMRASVLSPAYRLRKFLEERLSVYLPRLGWQTKYARISFGNERYSEVVRRSEHQGRMLVRGFLGTVGLPVLVGCAWAWWRWRRVLEGEVKGLLARVARVIHQRR